MASNAVTKVYSDRFEPNYHKIRASCALHMLVAPKCPTLTEDLGVLHMRWWLGRATHVLHYGDIIMGAIASQITRLTIVYSTVYSDADQRKHKSSASLAFVRGIHRGPHKWPITRKMFSFDDVIMGRLRSPQHVPMMRSTWATHLLYLSTVILMTEKWPSTYRIYGHENESP